MEAESGTHGRISTSLIAIKRLIRSVVQSSRVMWQSLLTSFLVYDTFFLVRTDFNQLCYIAAFEPLRVLYILVSFLFLIPVHTGFLFLSFINHRANYSFRPKRHRSMSSQPSNQNFFSFPLSFGLVMHYVPPIQFRQATPATSSSM